MVNGKRVYNKAVPVYLQAVSNLCNQLLRAGTSIGANNAEATNAVRETSSLRCLLVTTFIKKKFGTYLETTKKATFTSDARGTATWRLTQPYKDVTLTSKKKVFKVHVYTEVPLEDIQPL